MEPEVGFGHKFGQLFSQGVPASRPRLPRSPFADGSLSPAFESRSLQIGVTASGADGGIRTHDLHFTKVLLYH